MNREEIASLLEVIRKSEFDDVELTVGDLRLHVRKNAVTKPVSRSGPDVSSPAPAPPRVPGSASESADTSTTRIEITAPMLGVFYRASSPGAAPFVEIGDRVTPDQTIGLIEVMKLFSPVTAGVHGVVVEFLVDDSKLVEYGQPLLSIAVDVEGGDTAGTRQRSMR